MGIAEVRRRNISAILSQRFGGNTAAFARAIGRPAPNVHRWLKPDSKDFRGIGESTARDIERLLGLPRRALDIDPAENDPRSRIETLVRQLQSQGISEDLVIATLANMLEVAQSVSSHFGNIRAPKK